jgi:hypothetical protein
MICCAFLWNRYCVICRPTRSQCPSNIFLDLRWFSNKLRTFEKFLDMIENGSSQLGFAAFYATVGLIKSLMVRLWKQDQDTNSTRTYRGGN